MRGATAWKYLDLPAKVDNKFSTSKCSDNEACFDFKRLFQAAIRKGGRNDVQCLAALAPAVPARALVSGKYASLYFDLI